MGKRNLLAGEEAQTCRSDCSKQIFSVAAIWECCSTICRGAGFLFSSSQKFQIEIVTDILPYDLKTYSWELRRSVPLCFFGQQTTRLKKSCFHPTDRSLSRLCVSVVIQWQNIHTSFHGFDPHYIFFLLLWAASLPIVAVAVLKKRQLKQDIKSKKTFCQFLFVFMDGTVVNTVFLQQEVGLISRSPKVFFDVHLWF